MTLVCVVMPAERRTREPVPRAAHCDRGVCSPGSRILRCAQFRDDSRLLAPPIPPARPVPPTGERDEPRADVDVDVVQAGVGHEAAGAVVLDQPGDDGGLTLTLKSMRTCAAA